MRTNLFTKGLAFAAAVAAMMSCSKENEKEKEPQFPAVQEVEIAAGESKELTFTAEADWKLTIDKTTWCMFDDKGVETAQVAGETGEVTVKVKIGDAGLGFEAEVAKIDMTMGEKTQTVFQITRSPKERVVKMYISTDYGQTYKKADKLELTTGEWGSANYLAFGIVATYDWKLAELPEELNMSVDYRYVDAFSGKADSVDFKAAVLEIKEGKEPYEFSKKIKITDMDGNNPVEFPITYTGLAEDFMEFKPNVTSTYNGNVEFTADGFSYDKSGFDPVLSDKKTSELSVKSKNMKYSVHVMEMKDGALAAMPAGSWLTTADDGKGTITFSVTANTDAARTAYVAVLPEAKEKSFDITKVMDGESFSADYSSYGFKVIQKGVEKTEGFEAYWGRTLAPLNIVPIKDDAQYGPMLEFMKPSQICAGSADSNTYVLTIKKSDVAGGLVIAPKGFPADYSPLGAEAGSNLFRFDKGANWDSKNVEASTTWKTKLSAITILPAQFSVANLGSVVWIQFYKTAEEKTADQASATLVVKLQ